MLNRADADACIFMPGPPTKPSTRKASLSASEPNDYLANAQGVLAAGDEIGVTTGADAE